MVAGVALAGVTLGGCSSNADRQVSDQRREGPVRAIVAAPVRGLMMASDGLGAVIFNAERGTGENEPLTAASPD
jgi:hypothetical protein